MGVFGDIIYSLPSIQELGGGHLYYDNRPWTAPLTPKVHNIIRLLESQSCIAGLSKYNGESIDYDLSTFRFGGLKYGENIISRQARWVGVKPDLIKPWLVTPERFKIASIVISRGARWHGFFFPWKEIVRAFADDLVFVGLREEHEAFCRDADYRVPWYGTKDLLEVANIIAGADLFIGNQSSPLAIAEGLHKRTIVEVCCWALDCLYLRPGNIHVIDGSLSFGFAGRSFEYTKPLHLGDSKQKELMIRADSTKQALFDYSKFLLNKVI